MTTTVAGIPFDHHRYDERGDVLYLNVGEPRPAARGLETSEGHAIHYDESGAIIAITLLNVRRALEREGHLTLSLPAEHLAADELWPILTADEGTDALAAERIKSGAADRTRDGAEVLKELDIRTQ